MKSTRCLKSIVFTWSLDHWVIHASLALSNVRDCPLLSPGCLPSSLVRCCFSRSSLWFSFISSLFDNLNCNFLFLYLLSLIFIQFYILQNSRSSFIFLHLYWFQLLKIFLLSTSSKNPYREEWNVENDLEKWKVTTVEIVSDRFGWSKR